MAAKHWLGHWSRTQAFIAPRSAEAELNAAATAISEGLGLRNMAAEMGDRVQLKVLGDSSASMGILNRVGAGKIKHLETRQLWVQEAVAQRKVLVSKIPRAVNTADSLTHHWAAASGHLHFWAMGLEWGSI